MNPRDTEERPATRFDPDPLYVEPDPFHDHAHVIRWPLYVAIAVVIAAAFVIAALATSRSAPGATSTAPVHSGTPRLSVRPLTGYTSGVVPGPVTSVLAGGVPLPDTATLGGTATWYCGHGSACTRGYSGAELVAAIDPTLGIRRGTYLTVRHGTRSVTVRVVDVCACKGRRLIDLTSSAFQRLAPLSRGVIPVTIVSGAAPKLPPTSTK